MPTTRTARADFDAHDINRIFTIFAALRLDRSGANTDELTLLDAAQVYEEMRAALRRGIARTDDVDEDGGFTVHLRAEGDSLVLSAAFRGNDG